MKQIRQWAKGQLKPAIDSLVRSCDREIGKALVSEPGYRPKGPEYGPLLEQWHHSADDLAALEQEAFGWDHAVVGNWMCSEWKFPTQLANAIGAHHGTGDEEWTELPAVSLVAGLNAWFRLWPKLSQWLSVRSV